MVQPHCMAVCVAKLSCLLEAYRVYLLLLLLPLRQTLGVNVVIRIIILLPLSCAAATAVL